MDKNIINKSLGRLDVIIPEQTFEAGKLGMVSIILKNPFDVPIEVMEIIGPRSTDLRESPTQQVNFSGEKENKSKSTSSLFNTIGNTLKKFNVAGVSIGGISVEFPKPTRTININAKKNAKLRIDRDLEPFEDLNILAEEGAEVLIYPPKSVQHGSKDIIERIEPHCDAVTYLSVSTNHWLLFKPTKFNLSTQVKYRIDGIEKTQVVTTSLDVKPPIKSMIIGTILGALLGSLAKLLQSASLFELKDVANNIIAIGSATVMSLIATIALSRKTGTQAFITVEDFYGGFAVGALIGYGGSQYFEQAITPKKN